MSHETGAAAEFKRLVKSINANRMSTTTTAEPARKLTLDRAMTRIAELEGQLANQPGGSDEIAGLKAKITKLEAELKTQNTELFIWKTRAGGNTPSPLSGTSANSQLGAQQPAAQKLPEQMSAQELYTELDAANKSGDRDRVKVLYRELNSRRPK